MMNFNVVSKCIGVVLLIIGLDGCVSMASHCDGDSFPKLGCEDPDGRFSTRRRTSNAAGLAAMNFITAINSIANATGN